MQKKLEATKIILFYLNIFIRQNREILCMTSFMLKISTVLISLTLTEDTYILEIISALLDYFVELKI